MIPAPPSRRVVVASALALAACRGQAQTPPTPVTLAPLKSVAPFPVGAAISVGGLEDPNYRAVLLANFSQVTADWEMKMEQILLPDGTFSFAKADYIAAFARINGLRLHGHNLIWYIYSPAPFERLAGDKAAFEKAYANYILAVAGRYHGQAVGWDVVNEPVAEDGDGYRPCLWRQVLGLDYVATALKYARQADPGAVLFLNEYNLESKPKKRATFLRLVEDLMKQGAPLDGLGTQTHLSADLAPGAIKTAVRELAATGLKIHVSEFDVTLQDHPLMSREAKLNAQARLAGEAGEALAALPAAQRYGFTTWGVRDQDSWLRHAPNAGDGTDAPLLFDDDGHPKAAAAAFERAVGRS
ncbi:MAG TPA: endo-1,4-beta-xylanase [Caulobacteraceae bacterium]|nr:endo-1,4-beta-xylanase [Caulobacteraceae bacterium]